MIENTATGLQLQEYPSFMECESILYKDPRIKYFFEISLPVAMKRKKALGHILLVCPDKLIEKCFLILLKHKLPEQGYQSIDLSSDLQPRDFEAQFVNCSEGDILSYVASELTLSGARIHLLERVLRDFQLDVTVGKGVDAKRISLDLPYFTSFICVEHGSQSLSALLPHFEYIIKVDGDNMPRLCSSKVLEIAKQYGMTMDETACELIVSKAEYDIRKSERYLTRVLEYIDVPKNSTLNITQAIVERVFNLSGMGAKIEEPADEEEMFKLFREIRDSLKNIQNGIYSLRGDLERVEATIVDCFENFVQD